MRIVLSESTFCRWGLWHRISCLILSSVICMKLWFGYAVQCWFSPEGVYLLVTSPRISSYSNIIHPRTLATCYTLPTSCACSPLASFFFFFYHVIFLAKYFSFLCPLSFSFSCQNLLVKFTECKCQLTKQTTSRGIHFPFFFFNYFFHHCFLWNKRLSLMSD